MAFKMLSFVVEKAAEPLSNAIERVAARSPRFQQACVGASRLARRQGNRRRAKKGKDPLPLRAPDEAVKAGCEILGESIVWTIGLTLLAVSHVREAQAEAEQDLSMQANERRITQLQQQIDKERSARSLLEARVRELEKGKEAAFGGVGLVPWLRDRLLGVG